jgi:hypothetical protein
LPCASRLPMTLGGLEGTQAKFFTTMQTIFACQVGLMSNANHHCEFV